RICTDSWIMFPPRWSTLCITAAVQKVGQMAICLPPGHEKAIVPGLQRDEAQPGSSMALAPGQR
ncbi:hypothetical protein AB4144_65905, partial [Rhizobiaceae sp. 2RAB30]